MAAPRLATEPQVRPIIEAQEEVEFRAPAQRCNEVALQQLGYLIEHVERYGGFCGCKLCGRLDWIRALLLEIFKEPKVTGAA